MEFQAYTSEDLNIMLDSKLGVNAAIVNVQKWLVGISGLTQVLTAPDIWCIEYH